MIEIGNREKPKILIVDDEEEVLRSLADLLRKDFNVFSTSDVQEAQQLLDSPVFFSVVISDQRMPELTGAELLARAVKLSPDTARILLTGYADIEAVIEAVNQGEILRYVIKPWDGARLLEMLKPIADSHYLIQENRRLMDQLSRLNESDADSTERIEGLEKIQSTLSEDNHTLSDAYRQLNDSFWHLRKIQEVLPICIECGKVKTADSSWENVVQYLKNNSDFLSHGYCPECAVKMKTAIEKSLFRGGIKDDRKP